MCVCTIFIPTVWHLCPSCIYGGSDWDGCSGVYRGGGSIRCGYGGCDGRKRGDTVVAAAAAVAVLWTVAVFVTVAVLETVDVSWTDSMVQDVDVAVVVFVVPVN